MLEFSKLNAMPVEELRKLAIQQGLSPHPRAKASTLAKQIIEHVTTPVKTEMKHPAETRTSDNAPMNTEDQIRQVCKQFFDKEGFQARFVDDTWHFRYKGAEDSGHMSVPLRVIKMKAGTVAGGARKPYTVKNSDNQDVMMAGI